MSSDCVDFAKMGEAGRRIASRDYSWQGVTRHLLDVYDEVVSGGVEE